MTHRVRLILFVLAGLALLPAFLHVAAVMPAFGAHKLPYGDANQTRRGSRAPRDQHGTAVNFDYRGIDTLGEEFMLLCAATGVTVLLRGGRGEQVSARPGRVADRAIWPRSDAVAMICRLGAALIVVFGLYVALHATSTPGGGFQGGVILASGAVLVFLGEGYKGSRRATNSTVLDVIEGAGAGLYAQGGALDFSALERAVAAAPDDPVLAAAFALVATGLLIKAAQVPFHFWLSDSHTVAPSAVSVIFSGAMVSLGLFGVARLTWSVFAPSASVLRVEHGLFLGMGVASAVIGGVMALMQRHVKRLLAFSTISHVGIMLVGLSLPSEQALSGMLLSLAGHGLVKGALFMIAGIMLATLGGIDELGLRGLGRRIWPAGVTMAVGGLLLAGLPLGLMESGTEAIEAAKQAGQGWAMLGVVAGSALTGAAVLRVTGRVFPGLGPVAGEEERSPSEEEQEKADRPVWLMLVPALALLGLAVLGGEGAIGFAERAAQQMLHPDVGAVLGGVAPPSAAAPAATRAPGFTLGWVSVPLAIVIAALELLRARMPRTAARGVDQALRPLLDLLSRLHSGLVGDHVAWLLAGLSLFGLAFGLG